MMQLLHSQLPRLDQYGTGFGNADAAVGVVVIVLRQNWFV